MPTPFKVKISILHYLSVFLLLMSCNQDVDLLHEYVINTEEVAVIDDNFKVPSDMMSILDVLSNDTYASGNVTIIGITAPSHGEIIINEDNTITYTPRSAISDETQGETTSENTSTDPGATGEGASQETNNGDTGQTEEAVEETNPQEPNTEEDNVEPTVEAPATEQTPAEPQNAEVENTPEEAPTTEEAVEESVQEETPDSDENTPEEENLGQNEEDTFTYTTESENEDGSTTTETGTVTVEVETEPEVEPEPETESEPSSQQDYWRNPVIDGTRILDEKYYNLDTGEFYAKEVNLQRGQVENYIEHENCPQRIKDKWADRIEVTPAEVNGSQNGLKSIFAAHPIGSLFYLRAGIYIDQKHAVLHTGQDVVGEYGAILDGSGIQGNSADATRAIRSLERGFICNLIVREYPTWNDPLYPENPRGAALEAIQNGAILNCEVHSHNKAIAVNYSSKAMWNKFTAGRLGIHAVGTHDPNDPRRRGTIVKYNEWYNCNFNNYYYGHEAGGSKFVQLDGAILSHNYLHDNTSASGIWEDGDNRDSEIYNNVIINTYRSIFSEISYTSNIHHNTIEYGTGFGAIYMSNSQGYKVHHNYIRWSRNGIAIRDRALGNSVVFSGIAWRGINNEIYDNHIWQQTMSSGWGGGMASLFDGHVDPNNTSNRWHNNHYYVDDNAEGAALFSENVPFARAFMYSKLASDVDNIGLSWEDWKPNSGDTNSTLEYALFY